MRRLMVRSAGGGYHFRGITKMVRGRAGRRCRAGKQKSGTAYSLLAAPLLFFLFQIAGEPFKGNAEDAGEDGKLIVGHEAVAGLNAADCLSPQTNTIDLHLGGKGILG